MTVSTTSNKVSFTGNGTTDTFAYAFPIYATTDLKVYDGGTLKTLTTHYTVTGAGGTSGGNVVFTAGNIPADGNKVVIERILTRTQSSDYVDYDKFPADTLETNLDRLTFITQEIDEEASRAIKFATTVTDVGTVEIDSDASTRANKALGFDSAGGLIDTLELGNFQGNWAASTAYVTRDLVKDTSNGNIYLANTSHTSSGSQPISTNTDASKWDLIVDSVTASEWANKTSGVVASSEYSAKAYAVGGTGVTATSGKGAAKEWAVGVGLVDTASYSSKEYAQGTAASTGGSSKSWAQDADTVNGAGTNDRSAKAWAQGASMTGATLGGSSKDWAQLTGSTVDGTNYSAKYWATQADVGTVASNITDITTVAGKATEIGRLGTADAVADMNTLATTDVVADMNTLATADIVADMNTLATADVVADMNTLATADVIADMNTLGTADIVTDMNLLATSSNVAAMALLGTADAVADMNTLGTADVVSDLNTLGTADVVSDMNTLGTGTNVTNMNTLAAISSAISTCATNVSDINSFAATYTIAGTAPSSPTAGDLWYSTATNLLNYYTGSSWTGIAPGITTETDPSAIAMAIAL